MAKQKLTSAPHLAEVSVTASPAPPTVSTDAKSAPPLPPSTANKHAVAMEKRVRALLRKVQSVTPARLQEPDVVSGVVHGFVTHVQRKREYDDLFASPEAAAAQAVKWGLSAAEAELLVLMQANKDIFVPNRVFDAVLTVLFLAEVAYVGWDMNGKGLLLAFCAMLFAVDAVISRVKATSAALGLRMSTWFYRKGMVDVNALTGRVQMKKWTEQSWQLFAHVVFSAFEAYILKDEPWFDNPATCWMPHPYVHRRTHRPELIVLYMLQLAVWIYTCVIHRFVDERRKDYFVMYIHHIVTILLVAGSWSAGFLRIGLLVLWVHDVSDIFVDVLKMVNYLKLEGRPGWFLSEIAYVSCVSAWIYWRLYQFPFRVLHGSLVEPYRVLAPQPRLYDGPVGIFMLDLPMYREANVLLFILLILHIYWGHLFIMIGYRMMTESVREASRQEYEGDSDDDTKELIASPPAAAAAGAATTGAHTPVAASASALAVEAAVAAVGSGGGVAKLGDAPLRKQVTRRAGGA